jgi:uncharacterized membrane protein YkoI
MSPRLTTFFAVAALAFLLSLVAVAGASAQSRCYGEWSEAAPIVARERLRSALDVQDMAREEFGGEIVRIVLCEGDGGFTYRLVLRRLDGHIGRLTINAARGERR